MQHGEMTPLVDYTVRHRVKYPNGHKFEFFFLKKASLVAYSCLQPATLFTYYHASYIYIIHGGRERKYYKKTDNQNPSPETAKEATQSDFYI
jgi:hypothetical protein